MVDHRYTYIYECYIDGRNTCIGHQRECVDGACWDQMGLTPATCFVFCSTSSSWGVFLGAWIDRPSGCESPLPGSYSSDAVHRYSLYRLNAINDYF